MSVSWGVAEVVDEEEEEDVERNVNKVRSLRATLKMELTSVMSLVGIRRGNLINSAMIRGIHSESS